MALTVSVFAVNPREMKFPPLKFQAPEPIRFETDNGMVVFFLEDHQLPVVAVNAFLHGGSIYDPLGKSGLADITARLLRSGGAGSRTPEEVDMDLDFVGGRISSGTTSEELSLSLRCLKKDAQLVFEIFSDMMTRPAFDSGKVALEISNQKDEVRRQNDDPGSVSRRIYYETVYTGHPYGINPTLASLDRISRNDIIEYYRKYYAPDNCLLAISGDMTLDELKDIINSYFGDWDKSVGEIGGPPGAVMKYTPGVYYAEKDINQAHIRLGHLGMDIKNPDRYAMAVANFALGGGGFISRLTSRVRVTEGLAYSVGSYFYNRPYIGTFFAFCQTKAEAMSEALQMMLDIIGDVKTSGITQDEMELAKESLINSFIFNYDTPIRIVYASAYLEFYGFPLDQLERDLEAYQSVTLEECNQAAGRYLDLDNIAIIITGNKTMFDGPMETFGPVTSVSMEIR
jgi:predicted Zn-dependent peptidase